MSPKRWVYACECAYCLCRYPSKPGVVIDGLLICWRCKKNHYPSAERRGGTTT